MEFNPIFYIDFYKVGHVDQYPKGTRKIWVNFTPRSSRVEGAKGVVFAGLQLFIKEVLQNQFWRNFFNRPWTEVGKEYREVIQQTLGVAEPRINHIAALHSLGHFPIDIYALPEGTFVPLGVPAMVLSNNRPEFYWLPNYLETMMSNYLWPVCTSATTAQDYRKIFIDAAKAAGETDFSFVDWQGHDFSYRGMMGTDAAILSGIGHLLSFNGTDTVPAILAANRYYSAKLSCGGSVPATEHSVMCAGSKDGELETFRHLIEDVYKTGVVSIVSDTWDLWKVLTKIVPALKDKILARQPAGYLPAKVVIRPDSGDPVKILTGNPDAPIGSPEFVGALTLLAEALGATSGPGGLSINKGGLIYGDSITKQRAYDILAIALKQGFSPYNFVFGIGSYTYQFVTRDTYNFAFKATAIEREVEYSAMLLENGTKIDGPIATRKVEAIFKDPITDNAHKKSHVGIPAVMKESGGKLAVLETTDPRWLDWPGSAFLKVFNGNLLVDQTFDEIRARVRA